MGYLNPPPQKKTDNLKVMLADGGHCPDRFDCCRFKFRPRWDHGITWGWLPGRVDELPAVAKDVSGRGAHL